MATVRVEGYSVGRLDDMETGELGLVKLRCNRGNPGRDWVGRIKLEVVCFCLSNNNKEVQQNTKKAE